MHSNRVLTDNKRIALNTVFMYLRMFVIMSLGLYTSRIVLNTLGVDDYGLYSVIGGIIAMFGFINGAMTNTTSRYITFYLGRNDLENLSKVFSMAFIIHFVIAVLILVLGETVGLWYLYNKLVVPEGRFFAAFWLYQLSVASAIVSVLYVPFNAAIIAHEKMSMFAYISILDAILKFIIAILIGYASFDTLILYAILMFLVSMFDIALYFYYCKTQFSETKLHFYWNRSLFKEMIGFAGWSAMGNFSYIFYTQGINLILNSFCGTAVNAARGIAVQVESVVRQFATNVQTALNPQIIKSYADNDMSRMFTLIFASSRYCFYLLFLLALPIFYNANYILHLWLGVVPEHTVSFLRYTLVLVVLDGMVNPMFTANLASGKVKIYHITISIISYSFMPLTYIIMKYSLIPESVYQCLLLSGIIGFIARIFIIRKQIKLPLSLYLQKVLLPNFYVVLSSVILTYFLNVFFRYDLTFFIMSCLTILFFVIISVYCFGINKSERSFVHNYLKKNIINIVKK